MRKAALVALASVVMLAGPAFADGRDGHGGQRLRSSVPTRVFPHHHNRFNGRGFGGVILGAPIVAYGMPSYAGSDYVPPPPSYYPPAYSSSSPAYAPSAPMQTVIDFPNGRYVLQGDGVATPYRWVWIPNPPSAAPDEPPAPLAAREPSVRHLDFYRWTDEQGVTHFSDSLDRVPEALRSKVTKSKT